MSVEIIIFRSQVGAREEADRVLSQKFRLRRGTHYEIVGTMTQVQELMDPGTGQLFITGTIYGQDPDGSIVAFRSKDPTLICILHSNMVDVEGDFDHRIDPHALDDQKESFEYYIRRYLRLGGRRLRSKYAALVRQERKDPGSADSEPKLRQANLFGEPPS